LGQPGDFSRRARRRNLATQTLGSGPCGGHRTIALCCEPVTQECRLSGKVWWQRRCRDRLRLVVNWHRVTVWLHLLPNRHQAPRLTAAAQLGARQ
jgi:hypothetical protein